MIELFMCQYIFKYYNLPSPPFPTRGKGDRHGCLSLGADKDVRLRPAAGGIEVLEDI